MSPEAFVGDAYRALLGREADPDGFASATAAIHAGMTVEDVLRGMVSSEEFGGRLAELALRRMTPERALLDTAAFDAVVAAGPDEAAVAALYAEEPPNDYLAYHQTRFRELFAWLACAVATRGPDLRVLEVGTSHYTSRYYTRLHPALQLHTLCRPAETGGPEASWAAAAGSIDHHSLDLETADLGALADRSDWRGRFDLIVCCEVVEHLRRAPAEILKGLGGMLTPGGEMFVTTPNALSLANLRRILAGENPAPDFAGFDNNRDAHHHYREYSLSEMVIAIREGGLDLTLSAFSNAWEPTLHLGRHEYAHRGNLVVVGTRA